MSIVTEEMCAEFRNAWHGKLDGNPIREGLDAVLPWATEWGVLLTSTNADGDLVHNFEAAESEEAAHSIVEAGPTGGVEAMQLICRTIVTIGGNDYVGSWVVIDDA